MAGGSLQVRCDARGALRRCVALALWAAIAAVPACATNYRRARPDLPPSERTVAELSALLEDFHQAIADREFEMAGAMLVELEEGIKNADLQAITHWDFQRVSSGVRDGPQRLAREVRGNAIAEIEDELQRRIDESAVILTGFAEGAPTQAGLERLADLREDIEGLLEDGEPYAKDPRHAPTRERARAHTEELRSARAAYLWLWEVAQGVGEALAPLGREAPEELSALITHAEQQAEGLAACQRVIDEHRNSPGRSDELALETPLGRHTVPDTAALCAAREEEVRARLAHLTWRRTVENIARSVTDTLRDVEAQTEPEAILGANHRAVQTLELCTLRLTETDSDPGYAADVRFSSHLGDKTAVQLRASCEEVRAALAARQPTLRWGIAAARVLRDVEAVRARLAGAGKKPLRSTLEEVRQGFEDCATRAAALYAMRDADYTGASPPRSDVKAMRALARTCDGERAYVAKLLRNTK